MKLSSAYMSPQIAYKLAKSALEEIIREMIIQLKTIERDEY